MAIKASRNLSFNIALFVFLILAFYAVPTAALERSHDQYQSFFPAWKQLMKGYLENECQVEYANYMNTTFSDQGISYTVLDCLMRQIPEFRKAEMAASTVVLGLAPTLLQTLSPSAADTALIANRRPFLALLLSASTVSVRQMRLREFRTTMETLKEELPEKIDARVPFTLHQPSLDKARWLVSLSQYLIALLAAGNTAYRTYQLSFWAICVFVPPYTFLPVVWYASALAIHVVGYVAMWLIVEPCKRNWLTSEITPSAWGERLPLEPRKGAGYLFYVLNAVIYIGISLQILWGTMVLSSLVFLSVFDSVVVVAWYTLSTAACHAVIMYEFAGMRQVNKPGEEEGVPR